MLSVTVTCFTLRAIKSWCAAAVECVHSVCAGPVVLTGIACAVIYICFKGNNGSEKNILLRFVTGLKIKSLQGKRKEI